MSTKNMARTVMEGGRHRTSSWLSRHSHGVQRARQRAALARVGKGSELDDLVMPAPRKESRHFRDKLAVPRRWLEQQVGRPWNTVRGELVARFDTRTTPGRHILFCHMLPWVEDHRGFDCWPRVVVDDHGLLRREPARPLARHRLWREPLPLAEGELARWPGGRRVGARGDTLFWFTPTSTGAYRQHRRLGDQDAALWRSLPGWFRQQNDPLARS
jgi:hypothetical protein